MKSGTWLIVMLAVTAGIVIILLVIFAVIYYKRPKKITETKKIVKKQIKTKDVEKGSETAKEKAASKDSKERLPVCDTSQTSLSEKSCGERLPKGAFQLKSKSKDAKRVEPKQAPNISHDDRAIREPPFSESETSQVLSLTSQDKNASQKTVKRTANPKIHPVLKIEKKIKPRTKVTGAQGPDRHYTSIEFTES